MELPENREDLKAPTLVVPPWIYQGLGPPSCIIPLQATIYLKTDMTLGTCGCDVVFEESPYAIKSKSCTWRPDKKTTVVI